MGNELFGGRDVGNTPSFKEQAYALIKDAILFNRLDVYKRQKSASFSRARTPTPTPSCWRASKACCLPTRWTCGCSLPTISSPMSAVAVSYTHLILWINIGVFVGSVFAAIPGLSVILCVILFLPVTYTMTAIPGMMFLLGIYCAGEMCIRDSPWVWPPGIVPKAATLSR